MVPAGSVSESDQEARARPGHRTDAHAGGQLVQESATTRPSGSSKESVCWLFFFMLRECVLRLRIGLLVRIQQCVISLCGFAINISVCATYCPPLHTAHSPLAFADGSFACALRACPRTPLIDVNAHHIMAKRVIRVRISHLTHGHKHAENTRVLRLRVSAHRKSDS